MHTDVSALCIRSKKCNFSDLIFSPHSAPVLSFSYLFICSLFHLHSSVLFFRLFTPFRSLINKLSLLQTHTHNLSLTNTLYFPLSFSAPSFLPTISLSLSLSPLSLSPIFLRYLPGCLVLSEAREEQHKQTELWNQ